MKKLLIGLLVLGSTSSFATENNCGQDYYKLSEKTLEKYQHIIGYSSYSSSISDCFSDAVSMIDDYYTDIAKMSAWFRNKDGKIFEMKIKN